MLILNSVTSYSVPSGTLRLEHQYPAGANVSALVDVELVLENLSAEHIRVGEWVNVIGYITLISAADTGNRSNVRGSMVHVQALLLWSAGALDIQQYQHSAAALLQGR